MRALLAVALSVAAAAPVQQGPQQAQTQIRQTLASAAPGLSANARGGDLASQISGLPPAQKTAALEALSRNESELGADPVALAEVGAAYLALGSGPRALSAAERVLAQDPGNPVALGVKARLLAASGDKGAARQLLAQIPPGHPQAALALAAIQLERDPSSPGSGPTPAPAGPRPAAIAQAGPAGDLGRRISGLLAKSGQSAELNSTLSDAGGYSVADLDRAGIRFRAAPADQTDAVRLIENKADGTFIVSLRADALNSSDARAAAHVGNGIRQAETDRDHPTLGWAINVARGWMTGGRIHRELAPGDIDHAPSNPSDNDLMIQRRLLEVKDRPYRSAEDSYQRDDPSYMAMMNSYVQRMGIEDLFTIFVRSSGRAQKPN